MVCLRNSEEVSWLARYNGVVESDNRPTNQSTVTPSLSDRRNTHRLREDPSATFQRAWSTTVVISVQCIHGFGAIEWGRKRPPITRRLRACMETIPYARGTSSRPFGSSTAACCRPIVSEISTEPSRKRSGTVTNLRIR